MDIATLTAERDTAIIRRDAVMSSLEICQTLSEQQQAEILGLKGLLQDAGRQFRFYEQQHLAKGPDGAEKAKVNADFAARIEARLGQAARTQGEAKAPALHEPLNAWGKDDDGFCKETGAPAAHNAGYSILTWHVCQQRSVIPLTEVAAAFNVSPEMVREAAEACTYLWVGPQDGVDVVMQDGE